jgi:hypothetical protein
LVGSERPSDVQVRKGDGVWFDRFGCPMKAQNFRRCSRWRSCRRTELVGSQTPHGAGHHRSR